MSLCIAAHAYNHRHRKRQIILCSDAQAGDDSSVNEDTRKFDIAWGSPLAILFAGTLDYAEDAVSIYRERFAKNKLRANGLKEELYVGYQEFKDALKRRNVKRPDTELLVAGFIEDEPKIVYVGPRGVQAIQFYAAIGSGSHLADAILRWRRPNSHSSTHEVLYFVYEAKRLGEASPHVGKAKTHIQILEEVESGGFRASTVLPKGIDYLAKQFDQFGPRDFKADNDAFPWGSIFSHRQC